MLLFWLLEKMNKSCVKKRENIKFMRFKLGIVCNVLNK